MYWRRAAIHETLKLRGEKSCHGARRLGWLESRKLRDWRNGCADMVAEVCYADWRIAGRTLDGGQDLGYALRGWRGDELCHETDVERADASADGGKTKRERRGGRETERGREIITGVGLVE